MRICIGVFFFNNSLVICENYRGLSGVNKRIDLIKYEFKIAFLDIAAIIHTDINHCDFESLKASVIM